MEAAGAYTSVTSFDELDHVIQRTRAAGLFAFDVETDSVDTMKAVPVGFSLSYKEGSAYYIPLRAAGIVCLPEAAVRDRLSRLLLDPGLKLVGQNTKFDYKVLTRWGLRPGHIHSDTLLEAWVLESDEHSYGLDSLAERYLDYHAVPYEGVVPKGATLADVPLQRATDYSGEDADLTLRIHNLLSVELGQEGLLSLLYDVEVPLVEVLANMELAGIRVLPERLNAFSQNIQGELAELEKEIFGSCGHGFNLDSSKQLQHVLFTERKLKSDKRTASGMLSTDTSVPGTVGRK